MPKFIKYVLIIEIIILISAILFWWVVGDHTERRLVDSLFFAGALAIIIGYLGRSGSRMGTFDLWYQHFRTSGESTRESRRDIDADDMERSYSDFMILFTAGAIAIGISALIYVVF